MIAKKKITLVTALTCAAMAANNGSAEPMQNSEFNEVVVLATRTEQPSFEALSATAVIDSKTIEQQVAKDIGELLNLQASIDIVRNGSLGSVTGVQTRGANTEHALILINGQRFNSATAGTSAFQLIDPMIVERLEIVRGARSSLYGSDAIAGVINITTERGGENQAFVAAEAGTFNTYKTTAGISGELDGWQYGASAVYLDSEGFDSLIDDQGFNDDLDGFENRSLNLAGGKTFANKLKVEIDHFQTQGENHYDSLWSPETQPYQETALRVSAINFEWPLSNVYRTQLSLADSRDRTG